MIGKYLMAYGKANIGCAKPGFAFPMHLMMALGITGYAMEYKALGQYHVAHENAEKKAAMDFYASHGKHHAHGHSH